MSKEGKLLSESGFHFVSVEPDRRQFRISQPTIVMAGAIYSFFSIMIAVELFYYYFLSVYDVDAWLYAQHAVYSLTIEVVNLGIVSVGIG